MKPETSLKVHPHPWQAIKPASPSKASALDHSAQDATAAWDADMDADADADADGDYEADEYTSDAAANVPIPQAALFSAKTSEARLPIDPEHLRRVLAANSSASHSPSTQSDPSAQLQMGMASPWTAGDDLLPTPDAYDPGLDEDADGSDEDAPGSDDPGLEDI